MLKLYQFENCPFCVRVRDKLDALGIEYQKIEVDRGNKPEQVTRTGGTVPVLELEDGTLMPESADIIEYLEEHKAALK